MDIGEAERTIRIVPVEEPVPVTEPIAVPEITPEPGSRPTVPTTVTETL
jgi:hypothetical protein